MVYTLEYKRTIRVKPYETVTISLLEEFDGDRRYQETDYQGIKAQVDKWCDEAMREFGDDDK